MTNSKNIVLLVCTITVIVVAGLMALLVGLVLPNKFLKENHQCKNVLSRNSSWLGRSRNLAHTDPYIRERNKERHYGTISDFSWLVSVSIPPYHDDPFAKYVCAGVAISKNEVLTGNDCIRDPFTEADFYTGSVRSESELFWEGGIVHHVVDFLATKGLLAAPYDSLYILKVAPEFSKNVKVLPFFSQEVVWKEAIEAGWGGNKIPYLDIIKREPFHYKTWYKIHEDCCKNISKCHIYETASDEFCSLTAVIQESPNASNINGRPLVLVQGEDRFLVGIQMNQELGTDLVNFLDLRYGEFLDWANLEWDQKIKYRNGKSSSHTKELNVFRKVSVSSYHREKMNDANLYGLEDQ